MTFIVSLGQINRFVQVYHADVMSDPDHGPDVTYWRRFEVVARSIWGLESLGFDHSRGVFRFEVLDADRVRACGLASYGQFVDE